MSKCNTYPFCQCGAELVAGLKEDGRATDVWIQYDLYSEPEIITMLRRNGRRKVASVLTEDCVHPTSK